MAESSLDVIARLKTETKDFETRTAQKALGDLDTGFQKSATQGQTWARHVDKAAADAGKGAKGRMKGVGSEIGGELMQNIGEGIGNGKGNLTDAILGTIGGIAPALGVAGAVVGVGIFIAQGIIGGMAKEREAMAKAGRDLFGYARDGMIDEAERQGALTAALGVDTVEEAYQILAKEARTFGVDVKQYVAYIESGGKVIGPSVKAWLTIAAKTDSAKSDTGRMAGEVKTHLNPQLNTARGHIDKIKGGMQEAVDLAVSFGQATGDWRPVQAFDGANLALAMETINGWKSIEDRHVVLDIITSDEDRRRLASLGGRAP
jgi:hypothetical protein